MDFGIIKIVVYNGVNLVEGEQKILKGGINIYIYKVIIINVIRVNVFNNRY